MVIQKKIVLPGMLVYNMEKSSGDSDH